MSVQNLIEMSNKYGRNPEYVLAGGGNTSFKDNEFIYVKGSGCSLATIGEDGFVKLDRDKLARIFTSVYPEDSDEREAAVLSDLMNSRTEGQGSKRPSVETLLHNVIPFAYILHIHPALINGVTCARQGKKYFDEALSDNAIWIEPIMPGYILAKRVKDEIAGFLNRHKRVPEYIFLENHGVFIGADSTAEIDRLTESLVDGTSAKISRFPDFSGEIRKCEYIIPSEYSKVLCDNESRKFVSSKAEFSKIIITFTPDHMVYCGDRTLYVSEGSAESVKAAAKKCVEENGRLPKIIGVEGVGIICTGSTEKECDISCAICRDAMKIAVFAENFGGGKSLPDGLVYAINNWEVERYRKSVSAK